MQALGGAKNSLVVMPDAELEQAVPAIMGSAFGAAGQRCLAGSVAVVVGDESAARRGAPGAGRRGGRARRSAAGDDPATDVCPLVSAGGPRAGRGGDRPGRGRRRRAAARRPRRRPGRPGPCSARRIAVAADHESELAREELFGPLLALVEVADLDAAIEFVNGSRYGNAGAIFTRSGAAARRYRYSAEAGMLGVNIGVPAPVAWFPFSGWKDSIDGDLHANGTDAVRFYTRQKVMTTPLVDQPARVASSQT